MKRKWLILIAIVTMILMAFQVPEDPSDLFSMLAWLVTAPGAGAAGYALIRWWPEKWWPYFATITQGGMRFWSYVITGGVGLCALLIQYQLGYVTVPNEYIQRGEALFNVFMSASGIATLLHGLIELRGKPRSPQ